MKQGIFDITTNEEIAKDTFMIKMKGKVDHDFVPGQFINIKLEGFYLRRPISVLDADKNSISIVYKIFGKGTKKLSGLNSLSKVNILYGLGNGFSLKNIENKNIVLIGGGVGTPPLYFLAKKMKKMGINFKTVLGFRNSNQVFFEKEFRNFSDTYIATMDGKIGVRGFVTDVLKNLDYNYYFACGPVVMLKAILKTQKEGQISLEERMGCGFGACMGCSHKTTSNEIRRVCVEGPVFKNNEVNFDE